MLYYTYEVKNMQKETVMLPSLREKEDELPTLDDDLIEKLEKFISLPYEQKKAMGLAARAKVEKEFNRKIVVQKYLDELQNK